MCWRRNRKYARYSIGETGSKTTYANQRRYHTRSRHVSDLVLYSFQSGKKWRIDGDVGTLWLDAEDYGRHRAVRMYEHLCECDLRARQLCE